jgi:hypothetical protein
MHGATHVLVVLGSRSLEPSTSSTRLRALALPLHRAVTTDSFFVTFLLPKQSRCRRSQSAGERRRHSVSGHHFRVKESSHPCAASCPGTEARDSLPQSLAPILPPPSANSGECRAACLSPLRFGFLLFLTSVRCSWC